jgi:hypothetical protein
MSVYAELDIYFRDMQLGDLLMIPTADEETITLILSVIRKLSVDDRDFIR